MFTFFHPRQTDLPLLRVEGNSRVPFYTAQTTQIYRLRKGESNQEENKMVHNLILNP